MSGIDKLDKIHINGLVVRCYVGFNDWEREKKQEIHISVTLYADLSIAGQSDRVDDSVNYKSVKNDIIQHVEDKEFALIERIAEITASLCLSFPRVEQVTVTVDKLTALRFAKSVAVEITRTRNQKR